ncbi:hypothetical protein Tco_1491755 [Tanacetum coccineum]
MQKSLKPCSITRINERRNVLQNVNSATYAEDKHPGSPIPESGSDEVIKSSVENIVLIPSESEVTSDNERRSDGKFQNLFELFFDDEEIISTKIDPYYFNAESNRIESLLNRDTLIDSSPKFDYLLIEEYPSGALRSLSIPIPPGIEKADFDLEKEIRLVENLSYDNSSPRPPEELNAKNFYIKLTYRVFFPMFLNPLWNDFLIRRVVIHFCSETRYHSEY